MSLFISEILKPFKKLNRVLSSLAIRGEVLNLETMTNATFLFFEVSKFGLKRSKHV